MTFVGRLAAGTTVQAHRHAETEELYMIEGDLTVDGRPLGSGDFCATTRGSIHSSFHSEAGCTFVLLSVEQNEPATAAATDPRGSGLTSSRLRRDVRASQWCAGCDHAEALRRSGTRDDHCPRPRIEPGASLPRHRHPSTEQFYMLSGEARVDGEVVRAGDFYQVAAGTFHEVSWTEKGCTFLLIASRVDALA